MAFDKQLLGSYFDHGIDLQNRRVFLGEIDEETVANVIKGLYLMETDDETEPCEIFINSCGGSVYEALALYDIIQTLKIPVQTFAYGKCMSAAPLLLAAGDKGNRWVSPNCVFMYHQASDEPPGGKLRDLAAAIEHTKKLDNTWINLLVQNSTKDARFWHRLDDKPDVYFGAEEAIEWGIADNIWTEKD